MTTNDKRRVLLPIPAANALLAYLQERPYKEVKDLVAAILAAPQGEIQAPPAPEPEQKE